MVGIKIYSSPIRVYKKETYATIDGLQPPKGWPEYTINKDVHPNTSKNCVLTTIGQFGRERLTYRVSYSRTIDRCIPTHPKIVF